MTRMNFRKKIVALAMSIMAIATFFPTTAFASNTVTTDESVISNVQLNNSTRAGIETFHYGTTNVGGFTFVDKNTTLTKTIEGRYVNFTINFRKASTDTGIGGVKLTFRVMDENYNFITPAYTMAASAYNNGMATGTIDLGYAGRRVHLWFDASSTGASNGNFRSITIDGYSAYVS